MKEGNPTAENSDKDYFNNILTNLKLKSGNWTDPSNGNNLSTSTSNSSLNDFGGSDSYPIIEGESDLFSYYRVVFNKSDYDAAAFSSDIDNVTWTSGVNNYSVPVVTNDTSSSSFPLAVYPSFPFPSVVATLLDWWPSLSVPSSNVSSSSSEGKVNFSAMATPFEVPSFHDLEMLSLNLVDGNVSSSMAFPSNDTFDNSIPNSLDAFTSSGNFTTTVAPTSQPNVYKLYEIIIIALVTGILSLATLMGNLMVMISFKIDKQLQTISNYFLFSLAMADITIGVISMPLFTLYTLVGYWPLGPLVCDTWLALDYLASNASVLNLLIISFDRYFSVTRPLTYRAKRSTRRAAVMIGSAWIVSLILWPPWIYSWPYIEGRRTVPPDQCYIQFIETNEYVTFGTAIAAFYLPVTVMCGLYWRIWRETEKRQKDLNNLQAGKKDPSKRSNSSEAEECVEQEEWRRQRSESSTAMEEIETTYVPTAMVIDNNKFSVKKKGKTGCCRGLATCIKKTVDREENVEVKQQKSNPGFHTPGYHSPGYHTPSYHTTGYHTPGSIETTLVSSVSRCPSINYIKESTAALPSSRFRPDSMIPLVERTSVDKEPRAFPHFPTSSTLPRMETSVSMGGRAMMGGRLHARSYSSDSVYTILIRLPNDPSPDGPLHPPSILMIEEEEGGHGGSGGAAAGGNKLTPSEAVAGNRFSRGGSPLPRSADAVCSDPSGGLGVRLGDYSLQAGASELTTMLTRRQGHNPDIKLPLNAKIIPKQLAKNTNSGGSGSGSGGNSGTTGRKKKKKKTSEKKQDRKAAKTLSAILLAFIITWTPYNVLVLLKTLLSCKIDCIPVQLWNFAYYFCYINSMLNPMLYALCNAAFRRTYVRILTCKWHNRRKQGVQRGYYS